MGGGGIGRFGVRRRRFHLSVLPLCYHPRWLVSRTHSPYGCTGHQEAELEDLAIGFAALARRIGGRLDATRHSRAGDVGSKGTWRVEPKMRTGPLSVLRRDTNRRTGQHVPTSSADDRSSVTTPTRSACVERRAHPTIVDLLDSDAASGETPSSRGQTGKASFCEKGLKTYGSVTA